MKLQSTPPDAEGPFGDVYFPVETQNNYWVSIRWRIHPPPPRFFPSFPSPAPRRATPRAPSLRDIAVYKLRLRAAELLEEKLQGL